MSVHGVADKTVEILEGGKYPFVVLNFANPDMVVYFEIKLTLGRTYRYL
jgi:bisphosphoglycerate-independent phosphoglycerate mutase (AlkP superfamily)